MTSEFGFGIYSWYLLWYGLNHRELKWSSTKHWCWTSALIYPVYLFFIVHQLRASQLQLTIENLASVENEGLCGKTFSFSEQNSVIDWQKHFKSPCSSTLRHLKVQEIFCIKWSNTSCKQCLTQNVVWVWRVLRGPASPGENFVHFKIKCISAFWEKRLWRIVYSCK